MGMPSYYLSYDVLEFAPPNHNTVMELKKNKKNNCNNNDNSPIQKESETIF